MKDNAKRIMIIIIGVVLNLLGRGIALFFNLPAFLNVTGIIYATYHGYDKSLDSEDTIGTAESKSFYGSALLGIAVAVISGGITGIFSNLDWW